MELKTTIYLEDSDDETEVTVDFSFSAGCPAVMYLSNGDPGHPAEDDELEIHSVTGKDGVDVLERLSKAQLDEIEQLAFKAVADAADDYPEPDDARCDEEREWAGMEMD